MGRIAEAGVRFPPGPSLIMSTKETGKLGEIIAEKYLREKGYRILDRNYVYRIQGGPPKGEIDIVAQKDKTISFVEVKTLRLAPLAQGKPFYPEQHVDLAKQQKTIKAAQFWLMKNKIPLDTKWQIDVVAVEIDSKNGQSEIRHLKNAIFC